MAKANLTLPDGTTVSIDGSAEEVATLLERIAGAKPAGIDRQHRRQPKRPTIKNKAGARITKTTHKGPADYVRELAREDFFKTKRGLGEVKSRLEEQAHIYPVTSLSPVVFRLVKAKELRRIREDGQWKYVNP